MARSSIIRVSVFGDVDDLNKAFADSESKAQKWSGNMAKAGKGLTMGLTAPIVAGAGLATKAGAEEAQEMEKLAGVIRRQVPGATDEMIASNEKWITSMQNSTGVADAELRALQQSFIAAGASVEDSQKMVNTALNTSVATGKELTSIGNAMVKGLGGQTAGFSKLGISVKNADGSAKSLDEIMQDLEKHQGAAAEAANTHAGRAQIAQLKMADMAETIGSFLLPIMDQLSGWVTKIIDGFNNLSPGGQKVIVILAGVAAAVGPVLIVGAKLVSAFGTIMKAFKALTLLMSTNPWLLLIAAVVALVVLIVMNWDKIIAALKKAWQWIKDAGAAVWNWLKEQVKKAVDFIVNLFMNWTLPGLIMKHWDKIKEGVGAVIQWVKDKWNGLIDWFRELPGRIGRAISGLWDAFKTTFRNAINWVIGKWNNFRLEIKLPSILGGGTIGIDTPNIPKFHQGGIFRAPRGQREGLAVLQDRETVLPAGGRSSSSSSPSVVIEELHIHALTGDPNAIGRALVEHLQRYQRSNGPIPVAVRG